MVDTSLDWWETALRLLGAAGLGGVLGLERETDGQDAGFRTHVLLCLGAAVFAVSSVAAFDAYEATRNETNVNVDITRIASYVAAGIGFIGGGTILKSAGTVRGMTTAASLWSTAAIGLAAGLGFWAAAVTATLVALVALFALRPISDMASRMHRNRRMTVVVVLREGADVADIMSDVQDRRTDLQMVEIGEGEAGRRELRFTFGRRAADGGADLTAALVAREDVATVRPDA